MKRSLPIILTCLLPFVTPQSAKTAGPVGTFVLIYGKKCDLAVEKDIKYNFELKNINDGKKALDMHVELPEDIDETYQIFVTLDKWNQGVWQESFYKTNGGLLELINKYIPDVYKNILKKLSPTFDSGETKIPAGTYDLADFQDIEDSIALPKIFYGKLRMTFEVVNKNSDTVICVEVGAQSDE